VGDKAQRGARREWPNCCATSAHDRSFQTKTEIYVMKTASTAFPWRMTSLKQSLF